MGKILDTYLKSQCKIIESDLKSLINQKHKGDGKLSSSVKVTFSNGEIKIEANEYIKYLDKGNFLKDFTEKIMKELEKGILEAIVKDTKEQIKKLNKK